jgi:enterochelin esterase-like enzyme
VVAGGAAGVELVARGVLPGKRLLDELDGACSVANPRLVYSALGPATSGRFFSRARNCSVGYTIAYPSGYRSGDELPLIVALHGFGGDHIHCLAGMSTSQALALHVGGRPLPPMAMVSADGGGGYWHAHPGDDPMAMITDELIPMCQSRGLGLRPELIGALGVSMGGYGVLLLAEKHPHLISAVAAISPAVWTSYAQAQGANRGAYTSAANFAANDVVTGTTSLRGIPVRVASGSDDPFYPGVQTLARALPRGAVVDLTSGCHDHQFFLEQEPPSLAFLARHVARPAIVT